MIKKVLLFAVIFFGVGALIIIFIVGAGIFVVQQNPGIIDEFETAVQQELEQQNVATTSDDVPGEAESCFDACLLQPDATEEVCARQCVDDGFHIEKKSETTISSVTTSTTTASFSVCFDTCLDDRGTESSCALQCSQ